MAWSALGVLKDSHRSSVSVNHKFWASYLIATVLSDSNCTNSKRRLSITTPHYQAPLAPSPSAVFFW